MLCLVKALREIQMRASQFIDYLNSRFAPSKEKDKTIYTHLTITDKLKKFRRRRKSGQSKTKLS